MTREDLVSAVSGKISAERTWQLLDGKEGTAAELEALAAVLAVRMSDLCVCPLEEEEEVLVTRVDDSRNLARKHATYRLAPLARTRHQPDLKTFDLEVLDSACPGELLRCGLHTFVYHFGSEPVELAWQGQGDRSHSNEFRPGDSAYIAPMVAHRFSVSSAIDSGAGKANPNGAACGHGRRLFLVRIPGHLTGETLAEFATFSGSGRERVGAETQRWYS